MKGKLIPTGYNHFLKDIKQRIQTAQYEALKSVNKELILLYWDIGGKILENQKKHGWGKAIVETLAKDLQMEFPGVSGYSADNLWRMRKFYRNYANKPKLAPMVQVLGWTHNNIIICGNMIRINNFGVLMASSPALMRKKENSPGKPCQDHDNRENDKTRRLCTGARGCGRLKGFCGGSCPITA